MSDKSEELDAYKVQDSIEESLKAIDGIMTETKESDPEFHEHLKQLLDPSNYKD